MPVGRLLSHKASVFMGALYAGGLCPASAVRSGLFEQQERRAGYRYLAAVKHSNAPLPPRFSSKLRWTEVNPDSPKQAPIWGGVAETAERKNAAEIVWLRRRTLRVTVWLPAVSKVERRNRMNNRKRTANLTIRLTDFEKAAMRHKAARAKMNLTDFVVSSALGTELSTAESIKPLLAKLGRIGRTLDRLAAENASAALSSAELQQMIDLQQEIYRELCQIARDA